LRNNPFIEEQTIENMTKYIKHVQFHQFINLILLLLLGIYSANIYLSWWEISFIFVTAIVVEHLAILYQRGEVPFFSFSALSTAIGVTLMLVSVHLSVYIVLILLALAQKHFIKIGNEHLFNPSNFALIAALILFYDDAHLVLGQLGENGLLFSLVIVLSISMLIRVKRYIIPVSFVMFYALLSYIFVIAYDPVMVWDDFTYRFYSVSFIVFIAFMLTDPHTTPTNSWMQLLFALAIATGAVILDRVDGFRVQHLFLSLFLFTLLFKFSLGYNGREKLFWGMMVILALVAIVYIQIQPPYYLEMDG